MRSHAPPSILIVGAGGIGSPCAMVLADAFAAGAPAFELVVLDDDCVEASNLHRQILFTPADVGREKTEALRDALSARAPQLQIRLKKGRLLPDVALELVRDASIVVDATDNFASRFLAADAARLVGRPVVHAASVRWHATVLASPPNGAPCYRCLFEDLPEGSAPDCATAGVVGPVCGVAGALAADAALRILRGDEVCYGFVFTYDGRTDKLRRVPFGARASCALCGTSPTIAGLDPERYAAPSCD